MAGSVRQNAAIEAGRQRRVGAATRALVRWEWKVQPVLDTIAISMQNRVRVATEYLRNKVVTNISRPVTKTAMIRQRTTKAGKRGSQYTLVTNRSKAGEFPKADTTLSMKSIFSDTKEVERMVWDGYVGTPLSYNLILETNERLDRRFLTRTLAEERGVIERILSGPIK
jgi:hypothetical protein